MYKYFIMIALFLGIGNMGFTIINSSKINKPYKISQESSINEQVVDKPRLMGTSRNLDPSVDGVIDTSFYDNGFAAGKRISPKELRKELDIKVAEYLGVISRDGDAYKEWEQEDGTRRCIDPDGYGVVELSLSESGAVIRRVIPIEDLKEELEDRITEYEEAVEKDDYSSSLWNIIASAERE